MTLPTVPFRGPSPCLTLGCSACCHDTEMLLSEDDVARLQAAHPGLDFHFLAEDGYLQLRSRDAPPVPGQAGRPCVFLDAEGRCGAHDARPEGCRLYPAVRDGPRAILDAEHCPATAKFALTPATTKAVHDLVERLRRERRARLTNVVQVRGRSG